MKQFLKRKWVVPVGALVFTLAIGSAAFAATGSSTTAISSNTATSSTTATSTTGTNAAASPGECDGTGIGKGAGRGGGGQRSDETALTGDALTQAQAAALAEVGTDATVVRAETDADGNAKYEVHVKKADGTMVTVYLDESFKVVKTEEGRMGGPRGGDRDCDGSGPDRDGSGSTSPSSGSTSSSIS